MSKKFLFITGILASVSIIFQILLSGVFSGLEGILQAITLGLIVSLFGIFFRGRSDFLTRVQRNTLIFLSISGVCSLLLFLFVSFSNFFPASLSRITLSNGKSTLVFIEMSHIATEKYYRGVSSDLRSLASSGYTLYLEGVRPGSPENTEKFQKLLGIKLENDSYAKIAHTLGLTAQDQSLYAGISSGSLLPADISIDDIMTHMGTGKILPSSSPVDVASELSQLSLGENPLFHFIMRGVLNLSLRASTDTDMLTDALDPEIMSAILGARNSHLVSLFEMRKEEKAVFVYGALHFEGVYDLLLKSDPSWTIIDYTPLYPYVR